MFLRYFARTDESELGRAAAQYCELLVATGIPVRLVPTRVAELQLDTRGRGGGAWDRFRNLLITPMVGKYVNLVCSEPWDWDRFHTPGVRNILLFADPNLEPSVPQQVLLAAVQQFDSAFALTDQLADVVERVTGRRPQVAPAGMDWSR